MVRGSEDVVAYFLRKLEFRGLRFPGRVEIPVACSSEEDKKTRNDRAIAFAEGFQEDPSTFWTDGSAFGNGECAAAVAWYEKESRGWGK